MQLQVNTFLRSATPMALGAVAGYAAKGPVGAVIGTSGVHWVSKYLQHEFTDLGPAPTGTGRVDTLATAVFAAAKTSMRAMDLMVASTRATLCTVQAGALVGLSVAYAGVEAPSRTAAACMAACAGAAVAERLWGALLND